jgi:hypothetical protein
MLKFYFAGIVSVRSNIHKKRDGSGAGSVPLTNVSKSGRPKNMRILRIRIPTLAQAEKELSIGASQRQIVPRKFGLFRINCLSDFC